MADDFCNPEDRDALGDDSSFFAFDPTTVARLCYGRPLNSRERSIGSAHLPYCPRLRRVVLGKPDTVQITIRDTKDCFYLYEVPPSRVAKRVIGPRISQSWLEHLDGAPAVAKDEGRDRLIGDSRPLDSRERSVGRAHLPCCPRPRRMILGKAETLQITARDTKARRLLVLVDSHVVLWAVSKGRSSSRRVNFLLRNWGFGASCV